MNLRKQIAMKSDAYTAGVRIKVENLVVHETAGGNPELRRYVAPDDGLLGANQYNNDWNRPNVGKSVHGFIGLLKDKVTVATYQVLPWGPDDVIQGGHVSHGPKGYGNTFTLGVEICDDDYKSEAYFKKVYQEAVDLYAYFCKMYGFKPWDKAPNGMYRVVGHYEVGAAGYGSNHSDPKGWFQTYGKSMDAFRNDVTTALGSDAKPTEPVKPAPDPTPNPPVSSATFSGKASFVGGTTVYTSAADAANKKNSKSLSRTYQGKEMAVTQKYSNDTVARHEQIGFFRADEVTFPSAIPAPEPAPLPDPEKYTVLAAIPGYTNADNAVAGKDSVTTVKPGTYYLYKSVERNGAVIVNVDEQKNQAGAWIDTRNNVKAGTSKPVNPHKEPTVNVQEGSEGEGVKWVQWELVQAGYSLKPYGIDGSCGAVTVAAIREFQRKRGLTVDGICGVKTRNNLKEV